MVAAPARQRNVRVVNRTAIAGAVCLVLLAVFAALAVSVVNGRRPLGGKLSRSFATVASKAAGARASVSAPACQKVSVDFYTCSATLTRARRVLPVYLTYNVWLDDDGCWDTKRRTHTRQPAALGRLRARFDALQGCIPR
jgi:hypothetical protein